MLKISFSLSSFLYAFLRIFSSTPSPLEAQHSSLSRGSSLSVENVSDFLESPNRSFKCGFYEIGTNAFVLSIWFSDSADKTIVWTANRDRPVNGHGSRIIFHDDGSIALMGADSAVVWSTNTRSNSADSMQLLDTGNLVIVDWDGSLVWQSFDSLTDTLLPTQPITENIKLTSARVKGSVSSGYYSFIFDNNNILTLIYNVPEISSIYWPNPDYNMFQNGRSNYNSSRYGVLDEEGRFLASDGLTFNASDTGSPNILRRLTLDYDGNLRLYSLAATTKMWVVLWEAFPKICPVHGLCGKNGICSYMQSKPMCSCAPGYEMRDPTDWREGCKRKFNISCEKSYKFKFVELPHTDFWGYDVSNKQSVSLKACKKLCRKDCSCTGIQYKTGSGECYTKSVLFNGRAAPDHPGNMYLKVPKSFVIPRNGIFDEQEPSCTLLKDENTAGSSETYNKDGKTKWFYYYYFLSTLGSIEFLFITFGWWFMFRTEKKPTSLEEGYRLISSQFRRFTYKDLKRATENFKNVLGRGGSGAVYEGVLDDKRVVAVKKLEDAIRGEEEFWAEVSVIGKIYHMNLVRMWGFCSDGSHKLLVYEYIKNGSLGNHLFNNQSFLSWNERFKIALGVAKALAYLHHECLEWVIHCDVKPENILLGSDFEPKIADFGLAKLTKRSEVGSNVTQIRGTRGYMAPEWTSNLPITSKVDVYSYGVVLLEIVMGKRIGEDEGELELLSLVRILKEKFGSTSCSWVENFVDKRLNMQCNRKQMVVLIEIAVSCLEEERNKRPSMDDVLRTLLLNDDEPSCTEIKL